MQLLRNNQISEIDQNNNSCYNDPYLICWGTCIFGDFLLSTVVIFQKE